MGSLSKFGQAVPEIFVFQKRRFLWTRVKGKLHIGVALKTVFDGVFFVVLWIQTLITLSKIIQFAKIKTYFMQNFIEFYRKYFSCCKKVA